MCLNAILSNFPGLKQTNLTWFYSNFDKGSILIYPLVEHGSISLYIEQKLHSK